MFCSLREEIKGKSLLPFKEATKPKTVSLIINNYVFHHFNVIQLYEINTGARCEWLWNHQEWGESTSHSFTLELPLWNSVIEEKGGWGEEEVKQERVK